MEDVEGGDGQDEDNVRRKMEDCTLNVEAPDGVFGPVHLLSKSISKGKRGWEDFEDDGGGSDAVSKRFKGALEE